MTRRSLLAALFAIKAAPAKLLRSNPMPLTATAAALLRKDQALKQCGVALEYAAAQTNKRLAYALSLQGYTVSSVKWVTPTQYNSIAAEFQRKANEYSADLQRTDDEFFHRG